MNVAAQIAADAAAARAIARDRRHDQDLRPAASRSTTCRSRSRPGRSTRCSARTAPASRRWSNASWASTRPTAARCCSTARRCRCKSPRDARDLGIGMVYQQFTLVPCLTAAENLVISPRRRAGDHRLEGGEAAARSLHGPHALPRAGSNAPVSSLSAGEKQKLEILKLLYLEQRFLILDEPTSVLTPGEADEMLGLLGEMAKRGEVTVLMISHKFREVKAFCDSFTVLRRGRLTGCGDAQAASVAEMSRMMIGDTEIRERAERAQAQRHAGGARPRRPLRRGRRGPAGRSTRSTSRSSAGEIVGIAGVSGNGQSALVEVLAGQKPLTRRRHLHPRQAVRAEARRLRPLQGVRPAGGAAEERHRAAHERGREHRLPLLRQAADRQPRLVAVARPDAQEGARS